jgi:threonine/homoserine/homoserine lactone efflux protein
LSPIHRYSAACRGELDYIGGLWIAVTGLKILQRKAGIESVDHGDSQKIAFLSCVRIGVMTGLTNPQSIIFFAAIFAGAMLGEQTSDKAVGTIVAVTLTSVVMRCGIVRLATIPAVRDAYLVQHRRIGIVSGLDLCVLGMKLAVKALLPLVGKVHVIFVAIH